jgi:hypothetical protein
LKPGALKLRVNLYSPTVVELQIDAVEVHGARHLAVRRGDDNGTPLALLSLDVAAQVDPIERKR